MEDPAGQPGAQPTSSRPSLWDLPADCWATIFTSQANRRDLGALLSTCRGLRQALEANAALWPALFRQQYPERFGQAHQQTDATLPSWRQRYLDMHTVCHQLRSKPTARFWCSDDTAVTKLALHAPGTAHQLTISCQGSMAELRTKAARSYQLHGHSGQVSCVAVLDLQGAAQQPRVGVITASADQTVRLWTVPALPPPDVMPPMQLTLLTPARTLRGHTESLTCLELVRGAGVTIAATGAKDRTVRLWGLAPLLPSPANKSIATLRGHGAPVAGLAALAPGACGPECGSDGTTLLSVSLDGRAKLWDVWSGACAATARLAGPCSAVQPAAGCARLQPHGVFVGWGAGVQLLDLRIMRPVLTVTPPSAAPSAQAVHCFKQWGETLVLGCEDGARVYDLRALGDCARHGSAVGTKGGSSGSSHRLLLRGHVGPVTSVHVDRLKVVTATSAYGEDPVRSWCPETGGPLACMSSAPSEFPPSRTQADGDLLASLAAGAALVGQGSHAAPLPGLATQQDAVAQGSPRDRHYRRDWEGITALACTGMLLVTGNRDGWVQELDYSLGQVWDGAGNGIQGQATSAAGKFWQA